MSGFMATWKPYWIQGRGSMIAGDKQILMLLGTTKRASKLPNTLWMKSLALMNPRSTGHGSRLLAFLACLCFFVCLFSCSCFLLPALSLLFHSPLFFGKCLHENKLGAARVSVLRSPDRLCAWVDLRRRCCCCGCRSSS